MRTVKLLLVALLGIASVFAQGSNSGSITGTVSDPGGAVISGAAVEGKNIGTGVLFPTVTTDTGNYTLANLPPGNYEVTISVPGFKTLNRGPLEVGARQTLRIDETLAVGATSESVTVTDKATLLRTESAEVSYNISQSRLSELPVGNMGTVRNIVKSMVMLMPGAVQTEGFFGGVKINGTPTDGYNLRIDGMDNTYTLGNLLVAQVQPSVDAIQEYSIQTSNFAAELGQAGGAIFNVSMKSGGNKFHGSVYDYWANDALYASSPFVNAFGVKTKNPVSNYDWGFTVGGPISIPKVYKGKDRSFFFWSFETRPQVGQNLDSPITVPTDAYRNGDLSAALQFSTKTSLGTDPLGRSIFQNAVYDPASNKTCGVTITCTGPNFNGQVVRDAFAGNVIDPSRFDPVSVKILALVPKANVTGGPLVNNYLTPYTTSTKFYLPSFKIDHSINSKNKLNFFYSFTKQTNGEITTCEGLPTLISACTRSEWNNANYRLNYDGTISPTMLLHLGIGFQKAVIPQVNLVTGFSATTTPTIANDPKSALGITGPFTTNVFGSTFPGFGGASSTASTNPVGGLPQLANASFNGLTNTINERPTAIATMTWVKANHTYKYGGELRIEGFPNDNQVNLNGTYAFAPNTTSLTYTGSNTFSGNTIGLGYASFLLGLTNSTGVAVPTNPKYGNHSLGFFVQDTWKFNRKLTLDYGLRWDYSTYRKEQYGRFSTLDPLRPDINPNAGGQPGSTRYQATCGCSFANGNYPHSWGPRLGLAYSFTSKTVLRAGIGLTYNTTNRIGIAGRITGSPNGTIPAPSFGAPSIKLSDGIPLTFADIAWPNLNPDFFPAKAAIPGPGPANGNVFDQNAGRPSRQLQWSIGLQREISRDLVVEAAFVGNTGVWWPNGTLVNYNIPQFSTLKNYGIDINNTADAALLRATLATQTVIARGFKPPYNGFPTTNTLFQSLRPFPQFTSGLAALDAPLNHTWYDALQAKVTKRFSHGIDAFYAFTWQKTLTGSNVSDVFNRKLAKGLDPSDQPLQSVIAATYTVPKMNGINKILAYALYDWQVSTILSYSSAFPLAAPDAQNNLATAIGQSAKSIRVPGVDPFLQGGLNTGNVDPRRGFYLNPAAWQDPLPGQFGGQDTYGDYRAQRKPQEAMNFGRNFRIGERVTAQARVEFTNIFNRLRPANPSSGTATATPAQASMDLTQKNNITNTNNAGFGAIAWISGSGAPRNGQMVFRLTF